MKVNAEDEQADDIPRKCILGSKSELLFRYSCKKASHSEPQCSLSRTLDFLYSPYFLKIISSHSLICSLPVQSCMRHFITTVVSLQMIIPLTQFPFW